MIKPHTSYKVFRCSKRSFEIFTGANDCSLPQKKILTNGCLERMLPGKNNLPQITQIFADLKPKLISVYLQNLWEQIRAGKSSLEDEINFNYPQG